MDVNMVFSVFTISTFISFAATASERGCGRLEDPMNGRVYVDSYSVGGIARYECNEGYRVQGQAQALCLSNGEFDHSQPPVCRPVLCDEVHHFPNGHIEHINDGRQSYSYRTINTYHCNRGFRIKGPPERRCGGDGEWEGDEPFCQEIICAPLGPLHNGRIDYTERRLTWGTVAMFRCNADSDQFKSNTDMAMCEETGDWSDSKPECLRKAMIRPIKRGYVYVGRSYSPLKESKSVKHGTTVKLACTPRSELYSTENRRYMNRNNEHSRNNNGTWTPALPECVLKRCDLRDKKYKRFMFKYLNGTAARAKVDHNTQLRGSCIANYEFEDEYDETPSLFTCNKGNIFLESKCVPAFCSVSLASGMYLDRGTSEIIDDIGRIRHGTTINFRCSNDREYELFLQNYTDSVSDTCSYGRWLENVRPICKDKRCYLQVNEGAVFSDEQNSTINARRYVESGRKIYIKCRRGFRLVEDEQHVPNNMVDRYSTCSKGKWSRNLQCKPEPCYLQVYEGALFHDDHGNTIQSSKYIESGNRIRINCSTGFMMVEGGRRIFNKRIERTLTCLKGNWSPNVHVQCEPASCSFVKHVESDYWVIKNNTKQSLDVRGYIPSNTRVFISCRTGYRLSLKRGDPVPGEKIKYCDCYRGKWTPIYECEKEPCNLQVYEGALFYDDHGNIIQSSRNIESGNRIRINCSPGFMMAEGGRHERILTCLNGKWSANVQCEPVITEYEGTTDNITEIEESTTEIVSQMFSKTSSLNQNTSQTFSATKGPKATRDGMETTNTHWRTVNQADNYPRPTTVIANASVLPTDQEKSDSNEYVSSTSTLAYDSSDFVSAVTTSQANSTIDRFSETMTGEGCILPASLSADVISGEYLPGQSVPHGYSFDMTCWEDYEADNVTVICNDGELQNMPNCEEDIESDGVADCYIDHGSAIKLDIQPPLYNVSCDHGYKLNVSAEYFTCQDGHFYPDGVDFVPRSSSVHAECVPEQCTLRFSTSSGMKVQNTDGTYYSRESIIAHMEEILITCQEGFEPTGRDFKCDAGSLRPISQDWHFEMFRDAIATLECRKANCGAGCGSGVCILDDKCRCDEDHYGTHCEKAYCRLPSDIQHHPFKERYSDNTKLYDVYCTNRNAHYRGPSPLVCSPDGTWNEQALCHIKQQTKYRIHFVRDIPYRVKEVEQRQKPKITVYGDGTNTSVALLVKDENYRVRNNRIYVFKFIAEEINHVESVGFTSPFERYRIRQIKLELRNKAIVYSSQAINDQLVKDRDYVYGFTFKKEYSRTFAYQNGILPHYPNNRLWMPKRNIYRKTTYDNCEIICFQEQSFTCVAIVFNFYYSVCTTLSYSRYEYPEYFEPVSWYKNSFEKLYERQDVS